MTNARHYSVDTDEDEKGNAVVASRRRGSAPEPSIFPSRKNSARLGGLKLVGNAMSWDTALTRRGVTRKHQFGFVALEFLEGIAFLFG